MRIFKAIFFILLLSTQLIPIKEVGKNLWNQVPNEEEVHQPIVKLQAINKLWYLDFANVADQLDSKPKQNFIVVDEALMKCFHLEVLIQPPDGISFSA